VTSGFVNSAVANDEGNFYVIKSVKLEIGERDITENYQNEIDLLQDLQGSDRICESY
jgi:hypothetical protein